MKKIFRKNIFYKGFTLVELMIIIAIIGILSAVLYPSITGYFERARDTAKRQNVRQLELAITQYYIDNGSYKIPNVGYDQKGRGFINFLHNRALGKEYDTYTLTMDKALRDLGYTKLKLKTLYQKDLKSTITEEEARSKTTCYKTPINKDMYSFYFDDNLGKYTFFTFLEKATEKDKENTKTGIGALGGDGQCSRWGMNYVVTNK